MNIEYDYIFHDTYHIIIHDMRYTIHLLICISYDYYSVSGAMINIREYVCTRIISTTDVKQIRVCAFCSCTLHDFVDLLWAVNLAFKLMLYIAIHWINANNYGQR